MNDKGGNMLLKEGMLMRAGNLKKEKCWEKRERERR